MAFERHAENKSERVNDKCQQDEEEGRSAQRLKDPATHQKSKRAAGQNEREK
jgi:hypothetical protein